LDWLTDITDLKASLCGSNAAWDFADLDYIPLGPEMLLTIPPQLIGQFFACYITA
jgi:hypothetical protein